MAQRELSPERLRRRFESLAGQVGKTGWILLGTIHERRIQRSRRPGARSKTYGPYYQWTFKRAGRILTVNLSAAQVAVVREAIRRQRAIEKLLDEMRSITRRFIDATIPGVPKRKPRT